MTNKLLAALALFLTTLVAFTATATAAGAVAPAEQSVFDLLMPAVNAFKGGAWALGASLLLVAGVAAARQYAAPRVAFLRTDAGGALLLLVGAFGAALAASLATSSLSAGLAWGALKLAVITSGGWSLAKKLIVDPLLRPLAARSPSWAQPIFTLVFWFFDKPDPIATAEKAGDDAVEAKPSTGVEGVIGKGKELD